MMDYYLDDSSFPYSTSISNVKQQQEDHISVKSYGNLLVNDDNLSSKTHCLNEQCQSILLINNS
jgi:hypothetical protein